MSNDRLDYLIKHVKFAAYEAAYNLEPALNHPTAIFQGLRWDEDTERDGSGWRCYCSKPTAAYTDAGTPRKPWPGQLFLAFLNQEGVVYNWRWEKCDPDDPDLPIGHSSRFDERLL